MGTRRCALDYSRIYQIRCVTKTLLLLLLTMDPACARLDLLEMTLPELSSPPLLAVPATRVSWLVWDKRMPMLEMRLNPREVSLPSSTLLSTVSPSMKAMPFPMLLFVLILLDVSSPTT